MQGHSPSQKVIVRGKENVAIVGVEPVGNYAIRSSSMTATTPASTAGSICRSWRREALRELRHCERSEVIQGS